MTQGVDADLSSRKCRERELYSIPISSSWFKWDEIHESERRSLPEFFDGGSYSRSPRVYKEYRDFIINKFREDPSRRLTFTDVRKCLVGDVGTLRKVFLFLEKWGLINFSVSDGQQRLEEDGGVVVLVEVGPAAGVRVVPPAPSSSSSSSFADTAQAGGESGFRLPPLSSYSDAFGEWKPGSGLICGFCGGLHRPGLNESVNGGIPMCTKCSTNDTMNENTEELHLIPNDHPDIKDQSSPVWTDAETLLLLEAALKHGDDWDLIAQHVRTKNKFDCISRLIHLPFGDHRLGTTIGTKSSNTNLNEEYKSSLQVLNGNPAVFTEIDGDRQVEIDKTKGAEIASQGHPLKRRCFSPLVDTTDSFMKQVASLSVVGGSHVAAVAVDAAIKALCLENPSAKLAFETNGDKIAKPFSSPYKNEFKSDIKVEDGDAKRNKQSAYAPEKSFGATTFQVRAAIATSLAAAAARAKLIADQEEREMELLMASIIQAQVKKLQYKMNHLKEIELIMEKEYSHVQEMKVYVLEEWMNLLDKLFHAGIPSWRDQGFPNTSVHSLPL